jgi:phospholipid transport system substrate-binding protein
MKTVLTAFLLLLLATLSGPATAENDPAAPIHQLYDRLLEVMKQGSALTFPDRANRLRPVITSVYDMPAVTRSTLGLGANKLSPEELAQLSDAYSRYSVATYADLFRKWDGERFDVEAPHPNASGQMIVPTWVVSGDGSRTGIDYVMHDTPSGWRIIDVLFGGSISQVAVRRSEFVPLFRHDGLPALIALLDSKVATMEKKGG